MNLTERTRNIPTEMLLDMAAGMEDPVDIAYRYGFSASEFKKLEQSQQFIQDVAQLRSKHERSGEAAIAKAGMMHDALAEKYFLTLMANGTSVGALAAGVETFGVYGNRKPKPAAQANNAAQFSITFNIPSATSLPVTEKSVAVDQAERLIAGLPTFDYTDVTDVTPTEDSDDEQIRDEADTSAGS